MLHPTSLHRKAVLALAVALVAVTLITSDLVAPRAVFATTSGAQNDPAWDFGRGGAEVPGQPACYLPAPSMSERKMYSLMRPSCFPGHMQ